MDLGLSYFLCWKPIHLQSELYEEFWKIKVDLGIWIYPERGLLAWTRGDRVSTTARIVPLLREQNFGQLLRPKPDAHSGNKRIRVLEVGQTESDLQYQTRGPSKSKHCILSYSCHGRFCNFGYWHDYCISTAFPGYPVSFFFANRSRGISICVFLCLNKPRLRHELKN